MTEHDLLPNLLPILLDTPRSPLVFVDPHWHPSSTEVQRKVTVSASS